MAWLLLFVAGVLEVVWAYFMKQSMGFTRLWPSVATLGFMGASFALLSISMRTLPMGSAYAVWTGIGAVGTALIGIALLGEPATIARLGCIGLIVAGVVGLKAAS